MLADVWQGRRTEKSGLGSLTSHGPALVVEVAEDDVDTLVLLAEEILNGYLDVVVGNVGGSSGRGIGGLDGLGLDTLATLDEQHTEALVGLDAGNEIVGEDTVGDPLLGSVDDIVLAVGGFDGGGTEAGNIGAREGLGDSQANLLLAAENLIRDALLHCRILAEVKNAGKANDHTSHVAILEAAAGGADLLLRADHVVEVVKLLAVNSTTQQVNAVEMFPGPHSHVKDTSLGHLIDQLLADQLPGALLLQRLRCDMLIGELTHRTLEASVAVLKVRGLELGSEPEGLGIWYGREIAELRGDDGLLLAGDSANGEVGVLHEHLVPVQVVEGRGGILTGDLAQNGLAARVRVEELGHIVDDGVDNEPHAVLGVVLCDLVAGEGLGGDGERHDGLLAAICDVIGLTLHAGEGEEDVAGGKEEIRSFMLSLQKHRRLETRTYRVACFGSGHQPLPSMEHGVVPP